MENSILCDLAEDLEFIKYIATESTIVCKDCDYGLPEDKKYPMPDKKHVKLAIKFFNSVEDNEKRKELAKNINRKIEEFDMISEIQVGDNNNFKKFFNASSNKEEVKESKDSVMTGYSPIVPPNGKITKPLEENPLNMKFVIKR